ncbi:MAG: class III poly(R)-hydroxyalkanoic acid synthase subunit PhaC [Desulfobacteraceae bacterium]|nr:class III poly(R)-hydroxyalkanoic acid synthase subunit PhaC [Desulfobacteraceae bacterium]
MEQSTILMDKLISNLTENFSKVQNRMHKATDIFLGDLETNIATTPYDIIYEEDRVKLKHYRPLTKKSVKTPLLVIYALINRETMLDLQPGRSVVKTFLENGLDVYMIDWGYPSRKDRFLTIDDHVNGYINNIVDFILERENIPKINIMGICMGGTFSVIYGALNPKKVKNLITTVTPTSFDTSQGLLHLWTRAAQIDSMVDTFGNMPGDFLNLGFLLLNPARLILDKYVGFAENIDNKEFVENFIRMEKWIFDSPDVPGETFRQFIKDCYQKNLLIQNKMKVGDKKIDLKKVTMPLLNFYGKYDHLVPPEACNQLTRTVGSKDTQDVCLNTGHIGIYVSGKCQKEFSPKIINWLKKRDGASIKRRPKAKTGQRRMDK